MKETFIKSYFLLISRFAVAVICLIFAITPAFSAENDVQAMAVKADSAYNNHDYDEAITLYSELSKEYPSSSAILFNLGCAYYKSGNEGEARLCLERAHRLDPSDGRIIDNINYLESRIEDANKAELKGKKGNVAPDEKGFFENLHSWIADRHSSDMWAFWAVVSFVLLTILISLYAFSANVAVKKSGFFGGIVLFFATIIFVVFSFMASRQFDREDQAIVTSFKTEMIEEPADGAKVVGAPLHRGTKLLILESRLNPEGKIGWYKVKLNSDNIGWMHASDITVI